MRLSYKVRVVIKLIFFAQLGYSSYGARLRFGSLLFAFARLLAFRPYEIYFQRRACFLIAHCRSSRAALGFNVVFNGFESMTLALSVRHINYRTVVIFDVVAKVLSIPVMLIWAWLAPSVWALVAGTLAGGFFRAVLSHVMVPGPSMASEVAERSFPGNSALW